MQPFHQMYDPLGSALLSTLAAGLPILVLLYFLALHPHRDRAGVLHRGIEAPKAGAFGVVSAILVAIFVVRMPWESALSAWLDGAAFGMIGIGWIVVAAMCLYTMTLITGSFAITQFLVSNYIGPELTDILGGVLSMACLACLMLVWKPKRPFSLPGELSNGPSVQVVSRSTSEVVKAWVPWIILTVAVFIWGLPPVKAMLNKVTLSCPWPYLHGLVFRTPPVVPKVELEKAIFNFNWLAAPGTGVLAAALSTGIFLRLSRNQWAHAIRRTSQRMKVPLLTIGLVLGLGFVTRYSGTDAIIGLAFTKTGTFYPFFAAVIGWLGVFLTGSDTSSNALFGSLQKITAQQRHLGPVRLTAANPPGGVMG